MHKNVTLAFLASVKAKAALSIPIFHCASVVRSVSCYFCYQWVQAQRIDGRIKVALRPLSWTQAYRGLHSRLPVADITGGTVLLTRELGDDSVHRVGERRRDSAASAGAKRDRD